MTKKKTPRMNERAKEFFLRWLEQNRPGFYKDKEKQIEFEHKLNGEQWAEAYEEMGPISLGESWQE